MTKSEVIRFIILRSIGNFLLLFSIFGIVATFGPSLFYEAQFQITKLRGVHYSVASSTEAHLPDETSPLGQILKQQQSVQGSFRDILTEEKQQILVPKDPLFSLLIPKVGANEKVFPNVDPDNEKAFLPLLYKGVAHARGTVFPGMPGNIYLFAHSSDNFWDVGRYNAIFYLLKDMLPGDDIVIFFENRRHNYVVTGSQIVEASDVSYLVNGQGESGKGKEEKLILQTCWPPGTTWKRLLVLARPK